MAKIYEKFSNAPLIVSDEELKSFKIKYFEALDSGVNLSFIFQIIKHQNGLWQGTLDKIDTRFDQEKDTRQKHTFTDKDGIKRFHDKYGNITASIVDGYGLVDTQTQFMIDSKQVELADKGSYKVLRSLNKLNQKSKDTLNDLWQEYNDRHKKDFK